MSHSIICTSPIEIGNSFDYFLEQLQSPEPCCLTFDDYLSLDLDDFKYRKRYRPSEVTTDEPRVWASILFEPEDVIEFRLIPPREVNQTMLPRRFMQSTTTRQHGIYPWTFAYEIDVVVNKLRELNQGDATWWGVPSKTERDWSDIKREAGIPLNIYAGVNPRFATGCRKNEDILLSRNVFVDLDKTSIDEAIHKLEINNFLMPTMIVNSGHGVHFYWRLNSPINDLAYWTQIQKRMIQLFGSDSAIHDPSRPMRVPGFINVNGEPAKCYIHEADANRRYSLDAILALLPPEPSIEPKPTEQDISNKRTTSTVRLGLHGESKEKLYRAQAYANKFDPVEEYRNSTALKRTCSLVEKFDLDEDEVLPLIAEVNDKADDPLDERELQEVVTKAVRHVHRKGKPRGTALEKKYLRTEKYSKSVSDVIELDTWRKELETARLESLGKNGMIFFDGSTTGAGKSTADIAAIKKAKSSAIILPTHDACEEEAAKLTGLKLSAAAHPPLNGDTCEKFGTKTNPGPAQLAQNSGLNVGQCICTSCELFKNCKYQNLREIARNADHTICTHARASLSNFESAKNKPVAFVHV